MRKILVIFLSFTLCLMTISCSSSTSTQSSPNDKVKAVLQNQVEDGIYPVQQAEYNDADGMYTVTLLNTPPGKSSTYSTQNLQMARLTPEQLSNGKSNYLEITKDNRVMYLKEDFKIEYIHNVTETQTNPETGMPQNVVIRRESNFWTPFAGAMAGQALGNLLFSPQYYVPPIYNSGRTMSGYGSYGNTYNQANQNYKKKYNTSPPAIKNRQTLRTTGNLRNSISNPSNFKRGSSLGRSRSTGSGFGSSNLKNGGNLSPRTRRNSGFGSRSRNGSFRPRPRSRSFRRRR